MLVGFVLRPQVRIARERPFLVDPTVPPNRIRVTVSP